MSPLFKRFHPKTPDGKMTIPETESLCAHLHPRAKELPEASTDLHTAVPKHVVREINRAAFKLAQGSYEAIRTSLMREVQALADAGAPPDAQLARVGEELTLKPK